MRPRPVISRQPGPVITAVLVAAALLLQGLLAVVHAGSHARPEPDHLASAGSVEQCPTDRHGHEEEDHAPAGPGEGCVVCAAIAVGQLGWVTPPAVTPVAMSHGVVAPASVPAEVPLRRAPISCAPRGPPAAA